MIVSPEFAVSYGAQSGSLYFFIPDMTWGIELLNAKAQATALNKYTPCNIAQCWMMSRR